MFKALIYSDSEPFRNKIAYLVAREIRNLTERVLYEVEQLSCPTGDDALAGRVAELAATAESLVIISDRFAPSDRTGASKLAERLRKASGSGAAVTALMAVVDAP